MKPPCVAWPKCKPRKTRSSLASAANLVLAREAKRALGEAMRKKDAEGGGGDFEQQNETEGTQPAPPPSALWDPNYYGAGVAAGTERVDYSGAAVITTYGSGFVNPNNNLTHTESQIHNQNHKHKHKHKHKHRHKHTSKHNYIYYAPATTTLPSYTLSESVVTTALPSSTIMPPCTFNPATATTTTAFMPQDQFFAYPAQQEPSQQNIQHNEQPLFPNPLETTTIQHDTPFVVNEERREGNSVRSLNPTPTSTSASASDSISASTVTPTAATMPTSTTNETISTTVISTSNIGESVSSGNSLLPTTASLSMLQNNLVLLLLLKQQSEQLLQLQLQQQQSKDLPQFQSQQQHKLLSDSGTKNVQDSNFINPPTTLPATQADVTEIAPLEDQPVTTHTLMMDVIEKFPWCRFIEGVNRAFTMSAKKSLRNSSGGKRSKVRVVNSRTIERNHCIPLSSIDLVPQMTRKQIDACLQHLVGKGYLTVNDGAFNQSPNWNVLYAQNNEAWMAIKEQYHIGVSKESEIECGEERTEPKPGNHFDIAPTLGNTQQGQPQPPEIQMPEQSQLQSQLQVTEHSADSNQEEAISMNTSGRKPVEIVSCHRSEHFTPQWQVRLDNGELKTYNLPQILALPDSAQFLQLIGQDRSGTTK
ncbi:hypothetical protein Pelo_17476 [Pelomyxa schiedti]|nr:hypothetical protein Pelo_17476 [Pelomyxa schiedti]